MTEQELLAIENEAYMHIKIEDVIRTEAVPGGPIPPAGWEVFSWHGPTVQLLAEVRRLQKLVK